MLNVLSIFHTYVNLPDGVGFESTRQRAHAFVFSGGCNDRRWSLQRKELIRWSEVLRCDSSDGKGHLPFAERSEETIGKPWKTIWNNGGLLGFNCVLLSGNWNGLWKSTMLLMGKLTISTGPFSRAMWNYQRVTWRLSTTCSWNRIATGLFESIWSSLIRPLRLAPVLKDWPTLVQAMIPHSPKRSTAYSWAEHNPFLDRQGIMFWRLQQAVHPNRTWQNQYQRFCSWSHSELKYHVDHIICIHLKLNVGSDSLSSSEFATSRWHLVTRSRFWARDRVLRRAKAGFHPIVKAWPTDDVMSEGMAQGVHDSG